MMSLRRITGYVGGFLKVNGMVILLPAVVALYYGESTLPFIVGGVLCLAAGMLLSRIPREEIAHSDAILLSAATIIMVSLFGAVPFLFWFGFSGTGFINAFFESVSGYTTTGLSVIDNVEAYEKSLLFFRSLTQWVGGIGIIVLGFLALSEGLTTLYLYRQEQGSNKIMPSVRRSAKVIMKIYVFYTFVGFMLLWIAGMDAYSALNNVFTALSTGGFAVANVVYAGFFQKTILVLIMITGMLSFTAHFRLFNGEVSQAFRDTEVRGILAYLIIGVIVFAAVLVWEGLSFAASLDRAFYNGVSAMSTTGFADFDMSKLSDVGKIVLSVYMTIGAGLGSTGGGLKVIRVIVLVSAVIWYMRKTSYPSTAVIPFKLGGMVLEVEKFTSIWLYFFLYAIILLGGVIVLLLDGVSTADSIFVSSSALGTTGLSTIQISSLSLASKVFLSWEMLLGRVEIVSLIALLIYLVSPVTHGRRIL